MKVHTCLVCRYKTPYTTHMVRHLYRAKPCCDQETEHIYNEMCRKYPLLKEAIDKFKCCDCGREFKCNKSIYRHRRICNNTSGKSSSGNKVNFFGSEDISTISEAFLQKCRNGDPVKEIFRLVKRIYAEIRENRNVKYSAKRNCMLVYTKSSEWTPMDADDVKDAMIERAVLLINVKMRDELNWLEVRYKVRNLLTDFKWRGS